MVTHKQRISGVLAGIIEAQFEGLGEVSAKQAAKFAIRRISQKQVFDEAVLHLADRARHMLNKKKGSTDDFIADPDPNVDEDRSPIPDVYEGMQLDLFGCDIQRAYSIGRKYRLVGSLTDSEIEEIASGLERRGRGMERHAQQLRQYASRRTCGAG